MRKITDDQIGRLDVVDDVPASCWCTTVDDEDAPRGNGSAVPGRRKCGFPGHWTLTARTESSRNQGEAVINEKKKQESKKKNGKLRRSKSRGIPPTIATQQKLDENERLFGF